MNKKTLWIIIAAALVAIAAAVLLLTGGRSGGGTYEELLANTEFEALDAAGLPSQWYTDAWIATPGYTEYSAENGVVTIVNHAANDARFAQIVSVSPNTMYRLTARVKADCAGGYGANVSVEGVNALSDAVYDTGGEWREIALYGQTGESQTRLTVFARLGGYSGEATGEATFDSVSLMRVDSVPSGYALQKLYQVASAQPASDEPSPAWRWLLPVALAACAVCAFLARYMDGMREMKALDDKRERAVPFALGALLLVALGLRLLIAGTIPGYDVDIGCFRGWASAMGAGGPANFYLGAGHSDYPPAYMLVLWLVDALSGGAGASELAVKLPPILCDIGIALTLYYIGKRYLPATAAAALSMLFAFSPMAFATSAAWGQTDSVLTLLILLTVLFAADGKWRFALPVYMLSVLMKPQALMFGPLGLMALICELVWHFDKKTLRDMLIGLGAALVLAIAVIAPFSVNMGGVGWLLELYGDTMGQYGYASVNGCNLYFLFGKNWTPAGTLAPFGLRFTAICLFLPALGWLVWRAKGDYKKLLDLRAPAPYIALCVLAQIALLPVAMTYGAYSALMLCVCVVCAAAVYFRGRSIRHLPFMGGVLLLAMFVLGGMMHERYLFAAVPLFLVAYALEKDRRALWLAILLMATVFLNVSLVLDRNIRIGGAAAHLQAPVAGIESDSAALEYLLSALNCAALAYALYLSVAVTDPDRAPLPPLSAAREAPTRQDAPLESRAARTLRNPPETRRMDKKDWLIMLTATALYAVLALVNLGATQAPQTSWTAHEWDEQVVLDLGETRRFRALYYGGIHWPQNSEFTLQTSEDGAYYGEAYYACLTDGDCYQWKYVVETAGEPGAISYLAATREMQGRYILLTAKDIGIDIWEIQFRDADTGEVLPVSLVLEEGVEALEDAQALIDEQTVMTDEPSWFNSMYFDEVYHARTGYEHLHGLRTYETSHPPLGKVFISWAIAIFGMTPFGWRFAGALCGVLMLPGMYMLGKLLTKRRLLAAMPMLLLALDCMHFTQTRIATIDSFVVLFIILASYCMFRYVLMDFFAVPFWKTLVPLGLSGLFFGLAVASKWTGCYAGVGLAVVFFWSMYRRWREGVCARAMLAQRDKPRKRKEKPETPFARDAVIEVAAQTANKRILLTLACCLAFFVAIPALIYYLSYIPYFRAAGGVSLERVVQAAQGMLEYHSEPGRGADHPFASPWYEWPLCLQPIFYHQGKFEPFGMAVSITALGNLAIWWGGLLAAVVALCVMIWRHVRAGVPALHTKENDMRPALLLISYAAQFVPWMFVPRGTYIYHYFTSVPFIILCIALCFDWLYDVAPKIGKWAAWGFIALAAAVFIAYFPYASGVMAPISWMEAVRIFQNWIWY